MTEHDRLHCLAEHLVVYVNAGIQLPEETMFFVESTYGLDEAGLGAALIDDEFDERDTLLPFVFQPDDRLRKALEPCLDVCCTGEVERQLVDQVMRVCDAVEIKSSGGLVLGRLDLERRLIGRLVDKCYLGRALEKKICLALEENLPKTAVIDARLLMRTRDLVLSGPAADFLVELIVRAAPEPDGVVEMFSLAYELMARLGREQTPIAALLAEQQRLVGTIRRIQEFERRLERDGMEYLLMQRYPVPPESAEEVHLRLQLLQRIAGGLFGLMLSDNRPVMIRDLGQFDDLDDLFRTLT